MKAHQALVPHWQVAVALGVPAQPLRLAVSRVPCGRRVFVQRRRGEAAHQRPEHRRHDQDALHAAVGSCRHAQGRRADKYGLMPMAAHAVAQPQDLQLRSGRGSH